MKPAPRPKLKLPTVQQADLDEPTVRHFLAELEQTAVIINVIGKLGPGRANPDPISLNLGSEELLAGRLQGLQIRYRQEDGEWCDTLIKTPTTYRITRIKQADVAPE